MEEKSREQEMSAREISLIRELAQIRKEYGDYYLEELKTIEGK